MDMLLMKRMKELENDNRRLKRIYAEEKLNSEIARKAIEKKW
jgi:putative transposase